MGLIRAATSGGWCSPDIHSLEQSQDKELRGRALKWEVTEGSVVADPGDSDTFFVSPDFVFAKGLEGSQPFVHGSGQVCALVGSPELVTRRRKWGQPYTSSQLPGTFRRWSLPCDMADVGSGSLSLLDSWGLRGTMGPGHFPLAEIVLLFLLGLPR